MYNTSRRQDCYRKRIQFCRSENSPYEKGTTYFNQLPREIKVFEGDKFKRALKDCFIKNRSYGPNFIFFEPKVVDLNQTDESWVGKILNLEWTLNLRYDQLYIYAYINISSIKVFWFFSRVSAFSLDILPLFNLGTFLYVSGQQWFWFDLIRYEPRLRLTQTKRKEYLNLFTWPTLRSKIIVDGFFSNG